MSDLDNPFSSLTRQSMCLVLGVHYLNYSVGVLSLGTGAITPAVVRHPVSPTGDFSPLPQGNYGLRWLTGDVEDTRVAASSPDTNGGILVANTLTIATNAHVIVPAKRVYLSKRGVNTDGSAGRLEAVTAALQNPDGFDLIVLPDAGVPLAGQLILGA